MCLWGCPSVHYRGGAQSPSWRDRQRAFQRERLRKRHYCDAHGWGMKSSPTSRCRNEEEPAFKRCLRVSVAPPSVRFRCSASNDTSTASNLVWLLAFSKMILGATELLLNLELSGEKKLKPGHHPERGFFFFINICRTMTSLIWLNSKSLNTFTVEPGDHKISPKKMKIFNPLFVNLKNWPSWASLLHDIEVGRKKRWWPPWKFLH